MPVQRKSIRLQNFDYSMSGAYFVTLVSWKRNNLFGEIFDAGMVLNSFGQIVHEQWLKSAEIRQEIQLDEFIIMPNHFHAIVWIRSESQSGVSGDRPVAPTGETLPTGPYKASLGALIAGFKTACTKEINRVRNSPKAPIWQRNYYERIIRKERELDAVREYVHHNPLNWHQDPETNKYYPFSSPFSTDDSVILNL